MSGTTTTQSISVNSTKGDIPDMEMNNISVDSYMFFMVCVCVVLFLGLLWSVYKNIINNKQENDNNIEKIIDKKLLIIKTEIKSIKDEQMQLQQRQTITCEDVQELKVEIAGMAAALRHVKESVDKLPSELAIALNQLNNNNNT